MDLMLSHSNVRQTTYCNSDGQVLYRAETEYKISQRTTKITKVVPNSSVDDMNDQFSDLASIEWATLSNSKLKYGAFEGPIKDFLRSSGILSQHRTFSTPDGKRYKWTMGIRISSLQTDDGSKTPVAKMHRRRMGIFTGGKARDTRLHIFPGFEHLVDDIVVTFVFVEHRRKERERASRSTSGGGGA